MDEIDRHIIEVLQEDGRISMTDLGKRIGLSVPAVKERVNKLEDKEIIKGYRAIIDSQKINKQVTAFILYDTTRCSEFREFCKDHPSVTECHRLAGQYSYLVKVVTESVHTLEQFIDQSLAYGESSTLITLSSPVEFKAIW
ncbi:Lrp/AsnC family transcriptional regulator [Bacillus suaedaesalsae]|uniref:Lrp/AsnC family transcriptional regulator n=1 Tax=Bacillus suaedaesalsae TaxID=2810349 RepID=A0ABS2DK85_9BACI|nr:Lrp/AsnC family transcriptional regulator [Bacillus suaedaesalsae]MBM6618904.1 Lrp/AsnC family transcriptional regulator [Bacillus suaedaesalsae]